MANVSAGSRIAGAILLWVAPLVTVAAPVITRLTPPSGLFTYGDPAPPVIARFTAGQRFDLQATIRPDPDQRITSVEFSIDGVRVPGIVALTPATTPAAAGSTVATQRAVSRTTPGVRVLTVTAAQSDGAVASANGTFEIVSAGPPGGTRARNIIVMIGDGMGVGHRTATRVMLHGLSQGKALAPLAVENFAFTGLVQTASLDSMITDSAAAGAAYATGNKTASGHAGVFPDDTAHKFDNPRVELLGEFLARTQGKWLGVVTTADVADATPAAFMAHVQERAAATRIVDAYFDEAVVASSLRVLLGGGRRHFIPNTTPGSGRLFEPDGALPAELAVGWGVAAGRGDAGRDLLADFRAAGFTYVATRAQLEAAPGNTQRLLGLFSLGNLNAALHRIHARRGQTSDVADLGGRDEPMLDEMTDAALAVLGQNPAGFVLMVEGALIDKESHAMDAERWLHEMIEFDRAVARARAFAATVPDTLVIVTSDHETGGVNLIGASRISQEELALRATSGGGVAALRDTVVIAQGAWAPLYTILPDGYPATTNIDRRLLVGYAANADRHEDWQTNPKPLGGPAPNPGTPVERDVAGGFRVTGQVPGYYATHTGTDVPIAAAGVGASLFTGVMDNTDVFFKVVQAAVSGVRAAPADASPSIAPQNGSSQRTAAERLINLSTRGVVGGDAGALISGFVLSGARSHRLLIRGVGPTLAALGVANPVADPMLRLWTSERLLIAENDNWGSSEDVAAVREATDMVGAFALGGASRDAALLVDLPPDSYTVELSAVGSARGTALLEIYELP